MADPKYNKVRLVPWDPTDEKQFQRMYDQRVACGWREDEVAEWKEKMLRGTKFLYWIVSLAVQLWKRKECIFNC